MLSLARQVESLRERIAAASVEGLYADPFWFARYGEARARRFGGEDAVFHVRYLVQALDGHDAGILERYARWLQGLLVPRGMCSLHIDSHFQGLSEALVEEGLTEPSEALRYVQAARDTLLWPEGPAHTVHQALPQLIPDTLRPLCPTSEPPPRELEAEVRLHFSYLMDALGAQRPHLFVEHVRWYAGFWSRRALRCGFRELLEALEAALLQSTPTSPIPRVTVALGLTALEKTCS